MSTTQLAQTLRIRTKIRQQTVSHIYYKGQFIPFLIRGGKIVYADRPLKLDQTAYRMVTDAAGEWFEVGFLSAHQLQGNPTVGWSDPDEYLHIEPQHSFDLINWTDEGFITPPTNAVINNGDGTWWYWARSAWPKRLINAMMDYDLRSTRGQKSITQLTINNTNISLPGYPYAVETAMPTLQNHLRNAGFANAVASYTPATYTVEIARHFLQYDEQNNPFYSPVFLSVTQSGGSVTEVRTWDTDTLIPLPAYPYALPSQAATLQSDLVAAGQSGSVVRLFAGEWRVFLPDHTNNSAIRFLRATFTPNDPFPRWSDTGTYQGLMADNTAETAYSNLRTTAGVPVVDASQKQFCRFRFTGGSRGMPFLIGALLNFLKRNPI